MYDTPSAKENMKVVKKEQNKECIAKIGPWGGNRGGYCTPKVEPVCLNSITIRTGVTILQGIAFSYSDKYGKPHHAGTWGSHGGFVAAWNFHTILLGPSEYLIKISGTVGMSTLFSCKVVTSITFTTNISVYGPFGREEGTPFHSQLMTNGSIVGFFGRAGGLVDAIGTYVNPVRTEKKGLITKAGPWGGYSGDPFDVDILPRRLVSVVVHSNEAIVSIAFTYSDCNGQQHSAGPWGEYGESQLQDGNIHTIVLGNSEFLKEISGTIGPSSKYPDVVTSLLFVTNTNCYGPFGGGGGAPFCSPVLNNGSIVGFFVNSATQADNGTNSIVGSIGVYMDTTREKDNGGTSSTNSNSKGQINELNKPCITKIGLWGGHEGSPHDIAVAPICLNSITICSGEVVHSLAFSYSDDQGKQQHAGPWGVSDGCFDTIQLEPTEFLTQVSGTVGSFSQYPHNSGCVTSVIFTTNVRQYGPFGRGGGVPFHSPVMNNNGRIVGFFAHSGKGAIDAIGIYVNPGVPMEKRGSVTKVGPWGNHSAKTYDLDVLPQRLISVVVCSGQVIDSLAFTYIGCDGQQHSVGPWGGLNEFQHGSFHTILLGRSEFLKEISGTIKLNLQSTDVVTSLLLVTNTGSHGPFGESEGTPFRSPVQDDSSIVGFFAGAGKNLNALGAYLKMTNVQDYSETPRANQQLQGDLQVLNKALVMKIAPWGGHKGNLKDIEETPLYLNTVTIRSGELVDSLAFSYTDTHGKQHHVGPWGSFEGSSYGSFHTIRLCPSEFLTEVSGTIGFPTRYPANVVTSVKFITNAGRYGPFGAGEGIPFHSPLLRKGSIVGFFAYVGKAFNAIGLYVNPEKQTIREAGLITKVGPWGGDSEFSNDVAVLPEHLISVVVHSGKILLGASEILTGISGTVGQSLGHSDVVTSLLFVTNAGRYGPYGQGGGTRFQSPRQRDGAIVGFFANAGEVIDAIGVYFSPRGELIPEEEDGGSRTSDGTTFRERVEIYLASNVLEHILLNQSAEPTNLPLSLLQQITENFADERIIGRGGFGDVYKGDLQNGRVAVKRLSNSHKIEEEAFNREAISLISVRHKNIVRFLGYCANTESKATIYPKSGSNYVFAKMRERLLCFEYINNGSLDKYITDELRGLEWHTRYQIICGICDGLAYLHKKKGIIHRDIKPANILLDDLMIPKITDFGISKLLDGATHVVASKLIFSPGYCAPEMRNSNVVSMKTDIYSLGVIMKELVTGCMDNPDIKNVLRMWRYRWNKSVNYPAFGCEQVAKCIKIALSCLSESPKNRPDISDIVNMLNTVENANDHSNSAADSSVSTISVYTWELLEPDTLELNFAFEINKRIPCSVQLTNVTDTYVAFSNKTKGDLRYCIKPDKSVVAPRSKCSVMVTLQAREWAPDDMMLKDEFFSIRCVAVREGVTAKDLSQEMFKKKPGQVVDKVKLKVVIEPVTVVS